MLTTLPGGFTIFLGTMASEGANWDPLSASVLFEALTPGCTRAWKSTVGGMIRVFEKNRGVRRTVMDGYIGKIIGSKL